MTMLHTGSPRHPDSVRARHSDPGSNFGFSSASIGSEMDSYQESEHLERPSKLKHSSNDLRSDAGILPTIALPHRSHFAPLSRTTIFLIIFNLFLLLVINKLIVYQTTNHIHIFYLYYQPFAPIIAMLWFWALAIRHWETRGIRYELCFSAKDQGYLIPSSTVLRICGLLSAYILISACIFLLQCLAGHTEYAALHPPFLYCSMLALLIFPGPILNGQTRRFFASTLWKVITPGLRKVSFSDFLLADILTSLAKALSDVERAVCLIATGSVMLPDMHQYNDASLIIPLGLALPYLLRLVQCVRVYYDTGAHAQLANALKYCTAFPVIALSAIKYHVDHNSWISMYRPLWLLAAAINSGFSYFWDVEKDWEIGFFSQMRLQKTALPVPVLNGTVTYKRPVYLYLMVSNAILRLSWIYKLSPHLRRNHSVVFIIVLAEAFRRFQWLFVRIEVELRKVQAQQPMFGQLVPPKQNNAELSGEIEMNPSEMLNEKSGVLHDSDKR